MEQNNPETQAVESYKAITDQYSEYQSRMRDLMSMGDVQQIMWWQAEIIGHMVYLSTPLGYHRRMQKMYKAEYERSMRKKRLELLQRPKMSVSQAESIAKGEFADLAAKSLEHEGVAEELESMYISANSARMMYAQHIKLLTNNREAESQTW